MDGMLSQDEINALLNGISDEDTGDSPAEETMGAESEPAVSEFDTLTDVEKDAVDFQYQYGYCGNNAIFSC